MVVEVRKPGGAWLGVYSLVSRGSHIPYISHDVYISQLINSVCLIPECFGKIISSSLSYVGILRVKCAKTSIEMKWDVWKCSYCRQHVTKRLAKHVTKHVTKHVI